MEILAVRTSLFSFRYREEYGKTQAIQDIQAQVRKTIPGAEITRASWIHGKKTQETKQIASLIVYFSKKDDQESAILRGIMLGERVHVSLLYNSRLRIA